jgi:hypothetical protein
LPASLSWSDVASMTAIAAPSTAHRWDCPVIMKTHPDCVAYTCARCGAIGVVTGGESLSKLRAVAAEPASTADADRGCGECHDRS